MKPIPLIYLLGTSYSGSTLLGYLLGAFPEVFNAGELKQFARLPGLRERTCACNAEVGDCPFWSDVDFDSFRIYNKPSRAQKLFGAARILFPGTNLTAPHPPQTDDVEFLQLLHRKMVDGGYAGKYLLDASKSIYRLVHLLQYPELDLRIIYIERDIHGNVSSFIKAEEGFWRGLLTYKANHFLIPRLLQQIPQPHLHINYSTLCAAPDEQFERLGNFLGLDPSGLVERVRQRRYHVFTGSQTQRQFTTGFQGLRLDESWRERLTPLQKRILSWVG